jgi:hypothetical protein
MAQAFTITSNVFSFTATVQTNVQGIALTTTSLNVSQVNPGFTATVVRNELSVNSTDSAVTIAPEPVNIFTSTTVDFLIGVVEQTQATVDVVNTNTAVSVVKPETPITVNYNPTLVEHVYDGQPVYTTSSPRFKNITLGNTSTFTFPADDGTSGYALLTDGSGQLYWAPAGGGGGPGYWSLNDDLLTNGFKIKSGTDTVDLKIFGGGKLLDLAPNRTYLGTASSYLEINNGIVMRDGNYRMEVSSSTVKLGDPNTGIEILDDILGTKHADFRNGSARFRASEGGIIDIENNTAAVGGEELEYGKIRLESKTITITAQNIDIGANSTVTIDQNLSVPGVITTPTLASTGSYIQVPPLRFADGSTLSTAFIGTNSAYTTGTLILNGNLETNGYNIEVAPTSMIKAAIVEHPHTMKFTATGITLNWEGFDYPYTGDVPRPGYANIQVVDSALNADTPAAIITATNVNIHADNYIDVNRLRFPDGTVQTSAIPVQTATVQTIVANTGIAISSSTGIVEITNTGVRKARAGLGLSIKTAAYGDPTSVNTTTGDVYIGIDQLPITQGYGMVVDQTGFEGYTVLSVNSSTLAQNIVAGSGINITRNGGQVTINTTASMNNILQGDLKTNGYNIDGESNSLIISAGKWAPFGATQSSTINMPFNSPMRITSDYGIIFDTPDEDPIQILSPLTVLHRDGSSRISTDALGQTTLNDTRIAITGTNRVVINKSDFFGDYISLKTTSTSASLYLGPTKAIITATEIVLATTSTVKVGSDIYHSQLAVQDIVNYNGTGPVTVSKGIQFPDTTVQRTAYIGGLDFGAITAPATNVEQFLLQLQSVDFGTATSPSTLAFDAGVIE